MLAAERAPAARIIAVAPVVAHHEIHVRLQFHMHRAECFYAAEIGGFVKAGAIYLYPALCNVNSVARQADDAFYIKGGRVVRVAEHDHLPPPGLPQAVRKLVNDKIIVLRDIRLHGSAAYEEWLEEEGANDKND